MDWAPDGPPKFRIQDRVEAAAEVTGQYSGQDGEEQDKAACHH